MYDSASSASPKKRSRVGEYIALVAVLGIIVAAAAFQEPLTAFYKLKLWDRGAPGKVVVSFLNAGKSGDKAAADRLLGTKVYQSLNENGKWVGYFIVSQGGRLDIPFSDLVPPGDMKPSRTEFVTVGTPAAEVYVPSSIGRDVKYRLEMQQNEWKITEILGGHPPKSAPSSGNQPKATPPPFAGRR